MFVVNACSIYWMEEVIFTQRTTFNILFLKYTDYQNWKKSILLHKSSYLNKSFLWRQSLLHCSMASKLWARVCTESRISHLFQVLAILYLRRFFLLFEKEGNLNLFGGVSYLLFFGLYDKKEIIIFFFFLRNEMTIMIGYESKLDFLLLLGLQFQRNFKTLIFSL